MCSPVGHCLAALAIGIKVEKKQLTLKYFSFCVFSGCAADLDFLVGWYYGDLNGYHHLGSHSIFAALLYGLIVYVALRNFGNSHNPDEPSIWPVAGGLMYLSHIVLDWLAEDTSEPVGIQLLWPLSEQFMASPISIFPRFMHEADGADVLGMFVGLFNWHNFTVVIIEIVIFLPLVLMTLWSKRTRR